MDVVHTQEKKNFHYNLNSQPIIIPIIQIFLYFYFFKLRITPQTKAKIKHTSTQHKPKNLTIPTTT